MVELTRSTVDENTIPFLIKDLFETVRTINTSKTVPRIVSNTEEPVITVVVNDDETTIYIQAFAKLYKIALTLVT